ncbi:MAG: DUF2203 family protein [Planctomycetes bacterium]|nr:DUF2203 family protein [Planctomycetota bacterium]
MDAKLLAEGLEAQRYTLAEAERMIPLITSIAQEIAERHRIRQELHRRRSELEAEVTPEGLSTAIADLTTEAFEQSEGIRRAIDELVGLGLTVLRLNPVTIHIPGRSVSGPLVFCWQSGDAGIDHGHRIGEEDDHRRPLKVSVPRAIDG